MSIQWSRVTWYSQVLALVLFGFVFYMGFLVGHESGALDQQSANQMSAGSQMYTASQDNTLQNVNGATVSSGTAASSTAGNQQPSETLATSYACDNNKTVNVTYTKIASSSPSDTSSLVVLNLSDGRTLTLPQVISASGIKYSNPSGSFVFSSKGKSAFVQENGTSTFNNCMSK